MLGQRQLHQDAVDGRVVVECFHAGQQCGLGHVGFVLLEHRVQAAVFAGLDLVAHVDLAGLVVAHQDDGKAGGHATGFEGGGAVRHLSTQLAGKGFAVDKLGCHIKIIFG